jgi:hypothetical protein
MFLSVRVSRVFAFLRSGYPEVMPRTGYAPLAALLRRRLTIDEITAVTGRVVRMSAPVTAADIGVEITRITDEMPLPEDIERVQAELTN